MEKQFILRLPDNLKNIDPSLAKLKKLSQREVQLTYKDTTYPGIICKLPTIIESQKSIDNKLYKIADVSTMIVIFKDSNFELSTEISKIEGSGITPPMKYIRERKYKPTAIRTEVVEEIERKVSELLSEDAKAVKVEIIEDTQGSSEDIDMFAAEIESELPKTPIISNRKEEDKKPKPVNTVEIAVKPVPKEKIFSSKPLDSQNEKIKVPKETDGDLSILPKVISKIKDIEEPQINATTDLEPVNSELLELENKIKEKEELLSKALNPILKKRFEQAVNDLKAEYAKKKEELKGKK